MPQLWWGVVNLNNSHNERHFGLSNKRKPKRARRKQTPPAPVETFSGTLRVLSVPRPCEHLNRGRYEVHYEFDAAVLQPAMRGIIPVRIVREKACQSLRKALPGSTIRFDGRWSSRFVERELHVLRGEIIHVAEFLDGYVPFERTDGTWRWEPFNTPAKQGSLLGGAPQDRTPDAAASRFYEARK